LHPTPPQRLQLQVTVFINISDLLKLKFSLPLRNAPDATLAISTFIVKEILRARRRRRKEIMKVEDNLSNRNLSS
jgi:hypothetical protein